MEKQFPESDLNTANPHSIFRQRVLRWSSWIIVTIAVVTLMGLVGILVVQHPEMSLSLSGIVDRNFWIFTMIRWCLYGLLLLTWPRIAAWYGTSVDGQQNELLIASVLSWRWALFRILVVYELLFPFDLMSQAGKLL